ncbi:SMC-Scp complex subunit ScpB [Candidatus Uhrbacteria bacterium]|nr:SMC-Scp complex subunit ScpB [Candidatus Uhrbacteria bacterium]
MTLKSNLEALLFVAGRPMTIKKIAEFVGEKEARVGEALKELQEEYKARASGLQIFSTGKNWQMGTAGETAAVVAAFVKEEFAGELTRPQLETLTVIAYRGPISKGELEIIRGVSCGLILRNLLIRGLIDEEYDAVRKENRIRVSMDFLRYLGVRLVEELPDYGALHGHEVMTTLLEQNK